MVSKALSFAPVDRYRTTNDLRQAIEEAMVAARLVPGAVAVGERAFQARPERLGDGVVEASGHAACALGSAVGRAEIALGSAQVPVGDQQLERWDTSRAPPPQVTHRVGDIGHHRRCHVVVHVRTNQTSAAEVEDVREAAPSLLCRDVSVMRHACSHGRKTTAGW